jgi:hypothetical protein
MDISMFESFSAPKKLISLIALSCLFIGAVAGLAYASVAYASEDMVILSDGSIAAGEEYYGTGGGYSEELEQILASQRSSDGVINPGDAVAYNASRNSISNSDMNLLAGSGTNAQKIWSIVISSVALLCLIAYAIYTLIGYRREYEL